MNKIVDLLDGKINILTIIEKTALEEKNLWVKGNEDIEGVIDKVKGLQEKRQNYLSEIQIIDRAINQILSANNIQSDLNNLMNSKNNIIIKIINNIKLTDNWMIAQISNEMNETSQKISSLRKEKDVVNTYFSSNFTQPAFFDKTF